MAISSATIYAGAYYYSPLDLHITFAHVDIRRHGRLHSPKEGHATVRIDTHLSQGRDHRCGCRVRLRVLVEPLPITMAREHNHTKNRAVIRRHSRQRSRVRTRDGRPESAAADGRRGRGAGVRRARMPRGTRFGIYTLADSCPIRGSDSASMRAWQAGRTFGDMRNPESASAFLRLAAPVDSGPLNIGARRSTPPRLSE